MHGWLSAVTSLHLDLSYDRAEHGDKQVCVVDGTREPSSAPVWPSQSPFSERHNPLWTTAPMYIRRQHTALVMHTCEETQVTISG